MGCLRLPVLLVTITLIICHVQAAEQIHVSGSWQGGLSGTVYVHSNHALHGWTVHLSFVHGYHRLQTGFGTPVRINDHEWLIKNVDWDSTIQPWKPLTISFTADMGTGGKIPLGHSGGTYKLEVHTHPQTTKATHQPHTTTQAATTPQPTTTAKTTSTPSSTTPATTTPIVSSTTTTALPSSTTLPTTTPIASTTTTTALPSSTTLPTTTPQATTTSKSTAAPSATTTSLSSSTKLSTTTPLVTTRMMFTATSAPPNAKNNSNKLISLLNP